MFALKRLYSRWRHQDETSPLEQQSLGLREYVYEPLKSPGDIRLLSVERGQGDEPLRCVIKIANVHQRLDYEAISYTWGDLMTRLPVRCTATGEYVFVTSNAVAALKAIRSSVNSRLIWIDTICINQEDVTERNEEVRKMTRIYEQAKRVLVYLGPGSECTSLGIKALRYLRGHSHKRDLTQYLVAVSDLLDAPWFHRVWVIQEAYLGRNNLLLDDQESIDWDEFISILRALNTGEIEVAAPDDFLGTIPCVVYMSMLGLRRKLSMLQLLHLSHQCEATDPRDRIYALLGLARDGNQLRYGSEFAYSSAVNGINSATITRIPYVWPEDDSSPWPSPKERALFTPSYTLSTDHAYTVFTACMIRTTNSLAILCMVQTKSHHSSTPSWVPDWSCPRQRQVLEHPYQNPIQPLPVMCNAYIKSVARISPDTRYLHIGGINLGPISLTAHFPHSNHSPSKLTSRKWLWKHIIAAQELHDFTDFDLRWQATLDKLELPSSPTLKHCLSADWEHMNDSENGILKHLDQGIQEVLYGRCLIILASHFIGIAPSNAREHDIVAVLRGGQYPFVLREEYGHYVLIGECSIHDLDPEGRLRNSTQTTFQNFEIH